MIEVREYASTAGAAAAAAGLIARSLHDDPALVLGLPTGKTPVPMYEALVELHRRGHADFSEATTFNLDEFLGLPRHHPGTYRAFMHRHLFDHVALPSARAHVPDSATKDWRREAARYEAALSESGGLDLVILGVGGNGHIGFNEPAAALEPRTHRVRLTQATRRANADLFDRRWEKVPPYGLSMGMATILGARRLVVLATGAGKAAIVRRALTGPVTPRVPASFVQLHPRARIILDRGAASRLPSGVTRR